MMKLFVFRSKWTGALLCGLLLSGLCHLARADDDEDDKGGMTPDLQWKLADGMYNRREYDDAASFMTTFVEANPDSPQAMEALWRTYNIYKDQRPDPAKRKKLYDKIMAAGDREIRLYYPKDKERAGKAMWYQVHTFNGEGNRNAAIDKLKDMANMVAGTSWDQQDNWYLGEWLREAKRNSEAIPAYEAYAKTFGNSPQAVNCFYRIGLCYEDLKDPDHAVAAYKLMLGPKVNWGWGEVHGNAMDVARRVMKMGNDDYAREIAQTVLDKAPQNRLDILNQARDLLKLPRAYRVYINPQIDFLYRTDRVNIEGATKLNVTRKVNVDLRVEGAGKESPYAAKVTIVPKGELSGVPDNMAKAGDGAATFTGTVAIPDAAGNEQRQFDYRFATKSDAATAPADLVISRKWEKAGATWGNCTIRIQSASRWHIFISVLNDKTNVNNLSVQPDEVRDGGKTFHWTDRTDRIDLSQGWTVKFPVELGAAGGEYYPAIRLEQYAANQHPERNEVGSEVNTDFDDFKVNFKAEKSAPINIRFTGSNVVQVDEVVR